jgi:hypothetical protein
MLAMSSGDDGTYSGEKKNQSGRADSNRRPHGPKLGESFLLPLIPIGAIASDYGVRGAANYVIAGCLFALILRKEVSGSGIPVYYSVAVAPPRISGDYRRSPLPCEYCTS